MILSIRLNLFFFSEQLVLSIFFIGQDCRNILCNIAFSPITECRTVAAKCKEYLVQTKYNQIACTLLKYKSV